MNDTVVLSLQHIVKQYPGVLALDDVSLDFRKGEIHALVGENGAGKSTLIKTVSGAVQPNSGTIFIHGEAFSHLTPELSQKKGISTIYQEFTLVPNLSVAENIFLGNRIGSKWIMDYKERVRRAKLLFETLEIDIDPNSLVKNLSVAYQQMVEIAKALSREASVLIMDEPSAPLTGKEVETMFRTVMRLKESGCTIIYISHRLDEVFRISDRVSVMRDGQHVATMNTVDTNKQQLIRHMVGRELTEKYPRTEAAPGEVILQLKNVTGNGLREISLEARRGEILGIAGLVGAGRTELVQMIFGHAPVQQGEIIFKGRPLKLRNSKQAVKHGIGLIPEDRKRHGILSNLNILENISMPSLPRLSKVYVVNRKAEIALAEKQKEDLRIKTPSIFHMAKNLSGGNQQKVVLAKWLAAHCDLVMFDEPTRGIDVGAKQEIYALLNQLAMDGKCILMISSEMEEIIGMSDRMIVLHEGEMAGALERDEFAQDLILSMASGN